MPFCKSITGFRINGTPNVIACKDRVGKYLEIYGDTFLKSDLGIDSGEK
jgi:hypothetical protein